MCPQGSERWGNLEFFNYIIPRINSFGEEAVQISGGLTSYIVKMITVLLHLYNSLWFGGSLSLRYE